MNENSFNELVAANAHNSNNVLGLDPSNPMSYVLIAAIVLSVALVVYLIVLTSDSNKELTRIRVLLEKQSPTGNPTPSGEGKDKEPQAPTEDAKAPEWKPVNKEGGEL